MVDDGSSAVQQVKECSHGQRVVDCIMSRLTLCSIQFACAQSGSQLSESNKKLRTSSPAQAKHESMRNGIVWKYGTANLLIHRHSLTCSYDDYVCSYAIIQCYPFKNSHLVGHPIFRHTRIAKTYRVVGVGTVARRLLRGAVSAKCVATVLQTSMEIRDIREEFVGTKDSNAGSGQIQV